MAGLAGRYWSDELAHYLTVTVTDSVATVKLTDNHEPYRLVEEYENGFVMGPITIHFQGQAKTGPADSPLLTLYGARHVRYRRCPDRGCPDARLGR